MPDVNSVNAPETSEGKKPYTTKQMGDACEMLVAAELTLAGVPALKVPDNWPAYDVIAQPVNGDPQRISVKSRTYKPGHGAFATYSANDDFEWLVVVMLNCDDAERRRTFVIPRHLADQKAHRDGPSTKKPDKRYFKLDEVITLFAEFEDQYALVGMADRRRRYDR